MAYPELKLFIGGKWVVGENGGEDISNPATEEIIGHLGHASDRQIDLAIDAAARGFERWRHEPAAQRRRYLLRAAGKIEEKREQFIETLSLEQGKPHLEASLELDRVIDTFEWFADEAYRIYGRVYPERNPGVRNLTLPEPIGVVAAFTPWNFPAFLSSRKIAPALAAGCSVILKAAEETPGTAILLMQALEEAELPPGVVNLIYGVPAHVSQRLIASPVIRKISFTGSAAVGKVLARLASENLQRCTLELGGHSPLIVFPDANVGNVLKAAAAFKFRNAGQVCISPNRFYVHQQIYEEFVSGFVDIAKGVKVGSARDAGATMGPMANRRRLDAMERFVGDAEKRGARLATGGRRIGNRGFFWEPTVLADVPDDALVMKEEPFGPIAPVASFRDIDDVVARSNSTAYGLAAYVFTGSPETGRLMAEKLEAGTVGINHMSPAHADIPMGGVKESGYGYEGGHEGLDAYLTYKHVAQSYG